MALLQTIKRRLLLGGRSRAAPEPRQGAQPAAAPASPPQPTQPPTSWSPQLQRVEQASPGAQVLALATPRRILLGTLPAELAALEQQYTALPAHRSPSKEQLHTLLLAAKSPVLEMAAPAPGGATGKQASRSPRRLAKATKRQGTRLQLRKQPSAAKSRMAVAEAVSAVAEEPAMEAAVAAEVGGGSAASKQSSIDRLRQHQAHASAGDQPGSNTANSSQPAGAEAGTKPAQGQGQDSRAGFRGGERAQSTGAEQADQQEVGWGGTQERPLAARLTPRVLAAAAQRVAAQQQPDVVGRAGGGELGISAEVAQQPRSASNSHSSGDLGIALAPWAASGTPTGHGSDTRLPELPAQRLSGGGLAEGRRSLATPPIGQPSPVSPAGRSPLLMQRPPRAQLPADMLSLRESASLVRLGQATRQPLHSRRARSVQEWAPAQEEAPPASSSAALPVATLPSRATAMAADAAQQARPPTQPASSELSQGAKRLAALRRQRRS